MATADKLLTWTGCHGDSLINEAVTVTSFPVSDLQDVYTKDQAQRTPHTFICFSRDAHGVRYGKWHSRCRSVVFGWPRAISNLKQQEGVKWRFNSHSNFKFNRYLLFLNTTADKTNIPYMEFFGYKTPVDASSGQVPRLESIFRSALCLQMRGNYSSNQRRENTMEIQRSVTNMSWPTKFQLIPISGLFENVRKLLHQSEARKLNGAGVGGRGWGRWGWVWGWWGVGGTQSGQRFVWPWNSGIQQSATKS